MENRIRLFLREGDRHLEQMLLNTQELSFLLVETHGMQLSFCHSMPIFLALM